MPKNRISQAKLQHLKYKQQQNKKPLTPPESSGEDGLQRIQQIIQIAGEIKEITSRLVPYSSNRDSSNRRFFNTDPDLFFHRDFWLCAMRAHTGYLEKIGVKLIR